MVKIRILRAIGLGEVPVRERILTSQLALANRRLSQASDTRDYYIETSHRLAKANQGLGGEIRALVDENKELKGQLAAIHNLEVL